MGGVESLVGGVESLVGGAPHTTVFFPSKMKEGDVSMETDVVIGVALDTVGGVFRGDC